jgi:tetratricopeptide (TPR) repeat protein
MSGASGDKRQTLIYSLVLLAVTLSLFLPAMKGAFLWDDHYFISQNPMILGPRFLQDFLRTPFGGPPGLDEQSLRLGQAMPFYRPLTSFSYWLDANIWGLNPAGFHLVNILLHFFNGLLVLLIFVKLGIRRPLAFFGALLFSAFPIHFENVSWISGRPDLLAFFFAALSVYCFIQYRAHRGRLLLAASSLFYLFALLSKESAIFLILLFFLCLYQTEKILKNAAIVMLPFGLSLLIWFILRQAALGSGHFSYSKIGFLDFCAALGFYSFKSLFPFHLSTTIDASSVFANTACRVFGGVLLAAFLFFSVGLMKKRWPKNRPPLLAVAYFLSLLPSLLVIFSASTVSLLAWRFLYLPSAVVIFSILLCLQSFARKKAVAYGVLGLFCVASGLEIYPKVVSYGKAEQDFWLGIKDVKREDVTARMNIGMQLLSRDERRALEIFDGILAEKDHPLYEMVRTRIYEELASHYTFKKQFDRADQYFQELFSSGGGRSLNLQLTYAYYLALKGEKDQGEKIVMDMLRSFPRNHQVLVHASRFYIIIKDYGRAIELLQRDYQLFENKESLALIDELKKLLS